MKIFPKIANHSPLKQESESSWRKRLGETTFRSDFRVPDTRLCYTKCLLPPVPARINISSNKISAIDVEEKYKSASKAAYENPNSQRRLKSASYNKQAVHHTNFKMCVDNNFDGFCTTNRIEYPVRKPDVSLPSCQGFDLSVLKLSDPCPLGNKILGSATKSEYLDSFRGIASESLHQKVKQNYNQDHVKYHSCYNMEPYVTTSMDTYRTNAVEKTPLPHSALLQQNRITSIPFGDKEKVHETMSSSQDTYRNNNLSSNYHQYSKSNANSSTYRSSVKLGDRGKINEVKSIPLPLHTSAEKQQPITYERNASSLPPGDLNNDRVKERMSLLTSRKAHSKPPPDCFPDHINTSRFHTKSYVHFGHAKQIPTHQSTTKTSYHPLSMSTVQHVRAPLKDNIPFDYSNDKLCSTVNESYGVKNSKPNRLNKRVLENLKKSHWELPNMGISAYSTTQQASFTYPVL